MRATMSLVCMAVLMYIYFVGTVQGQHNDCLVGAACLKCTKEGSTKVVRLSFISMLFHRRVYLIVCCRYCNTKFDVGIGSNNKPSCTCPEASSNCNVGSECDTCEEDHYKTLKIGPITAKVCCSDCSKYVDAGYRKSDKKPYCNCIRDEIKGNCWKGEQCEQCLAGPNRTTAHINTVPLCCAQCEKGLMLYGRRLCQCF